VIVTRRARETARRRSAPEPPTLEGILSRHARIALACLLGLALLLAIWRRFVLDDAFISFNYARSLLEGRGLTWFGTRVEGYSNFLWVLWIAGGLSLGVDAVLWSQMGSIAAFLLTVYGLWRLGGRVFGARLPTLAATLLLVTNYTVASYATSGLETMLQTALLCWVAVIVYDLWATRAASAGQCLAVSLLAALAILTRLDSALPIAVLAVAALVILPRSVLPGRRIALLVGPGAVVVAAWLAWKLGFYHRLLPNSFYCKVSGNPGMLLNGLRYVQSFFAWYLLWPLLVLGAAVHVWRRLPVPPTLLPIVALVVSWCAYVVAVGGDFMEFRFLVPAAPFVFLLVAYCAHGILGLAVLRRPVLAVVLSLGVLMAASIWHGSVFRGVSSDKTLDSIPALASFYDVYEDGDWGRIGRGIKPGLGDLEVVISLDAVGAIPFYSGIRTVDMYGLNDPDIAAHGLRAPAFYVRPGHQWRVPEAELRRQGVNLVFGNPTLIPAGSLLSPELKPTVSSWLMRCRSASPQAGERTAVVAVPLERGLTVLAWYLTPTPALDERIRSRGWEHGVFVWAAGS
jgi:arabinofuranosyltransferase